MEIETDVVIVGAGPCGLFQVFELGLLGLKAQLVDSMPRAGGQCAELYPDKPIYDIPAYPVIGAQELVDRLMVQIEPFHPGLHLGQEVASVDGNADEGFRVTTGKGTVFRAGAVVIAGGVGSFQPRRLKVEGAAALEGDSIHYKVIDPERFDDQRLVVLGGGDSALDWALELQPRARSMTVVHRRAQYRAQPASVERLMALCDAGKANALQGFATAVHAAEGRLTGLTIKDAEARETDLEADQLLVFWGLHPSLGPIAEWGLELERRQLPVDTERFQTSREGIFAVGDINTYPGKKKLILSGFHEAALAAFAIRQMLYPEEKVHLQYTTTSSKIQERLGVRK